MQRDRHSITMTPLELDERIAAARSDLEAQLVAAKAKADAHERDWYSAKSEFGDAMAAPPADEKEK